MELTRDEIGDSGKRQIAVISVTNKEGIVQFCKDLNELVPTDFVSTGGTAKTLREGGVERVFDMQLLVGGPELFGDLVKSLSREVATGALAPEGAEADAVLTELGYKRIDVFVVDFYNLKKAVKAPDATRETIVKATDVGGPTMTHEAAKGFRDIISRIEDREPYLDWIRAGRLNEDEYLEGLRARAEFEVTRHIGISAQYHGGGQFFVVTGDWVKKLRYGENPNQALAFLYATDMDDPDPLATHQFKTVDGKEASLINETDLDRLLWYITRIAAAWQINYSFVPKIAIAVKHGNACGAAVGRDATEVLARMVAGDLRAIFGGAVITNFQIGKEEATILRNHLVPSSSGRRILDEVIAPCFTTEAVELLARKEDRCRMIENSALAALSVDSLCMTPLIRPVRGGLLVQPSYNTFILNLSAPEVIKHGATTKEQQQDMVLAWAIESLSNSNTITIVKNRMLIGNGVGQQDRVGGASVAIFRAGESSHNMTGSVAASDSFFPFSDGPLALINAGASAIFATSGSVKDNETIELCRQRGVALYLIPDKMGRGFAWH